MLKRFFRVLTLLVILCTSSFVLFVNSAHAASKSISPHVTDVHHQQTKVTPDLSSPCINPLIKETKTSLTTALYYNIGITLYNECGEDLRTYSWNAYSSVNCSGQQPQDFSIGSGSSTHLPDQIGHLVLFSHRIAVCSLDGINYPPTTVSFSVIASGTTASGIFATGQSTVLWITPFP